MKYITLFILSLIFWLLLTFKLTVPNIIVGCVCFMLSPHYSLEDFL